jgi:glycosyltransferase involved in cell wall biosynthesis
VRVHVVDPSAFTPPYDHALCAALAGAGADVELITGPFGYGSVPEPDGYVRREIFYRGLPGAPGSRVRRLAKAATHVPDMLRYRGTAARQADIVHFQWLDMQWVDRSLLPRRRPVVLTAHDLLPREARLGQASAQRRLLEAVDAVIAHSEYGRRILVDGLALDPARVHVVPHGAFTHLRRLAGGRLPEPLSDVDAPVVLFFGLLRPYKGLDTLLDAWRGIDGAELWVVGRPQHADRRAAGKRPGGRALRHPVRLRCRARRLLRTRRHRRAALLGDRAHRPVRGAGHRTGLRPPGCGQ